MRFPLSKSITLIELLIATALVSVIVLGLSSIDIFSRHHVLTSERRIKLQNEVSYIIDHMTKNLSQAFGNTVIDPVNDPSTDDVVDVLLCDGNPPNVGVAVYVEDIDGNGRPQGSVDRRIAYIFRPSDNMLKFFNNYGGGCTPDLAGEILSNQIVSFIPGFAPGASGNYSNYIDLQITACWDPDGSPNPCGTPDNPNVNMRAHIMLPSVSTN